MPVIFVFTLLVALAVPVAPAAMEIGFRQSPPSSDLGTWAPASPYEMADHPDGHTLFVGTELADTIAGTPEEDHIRGLEGDDLLTGLGGDDIVDGGQGDDTIQGGPGNDILVGGPGEDEFEPGPGNDLVYAGGGPDVVFLMLQENAMDFDRADGGPGVDALVLDITGLPDATGLISAINALHEEAIAGGVPLDLSSLGFGVMATSFEILHIFFGPAHGPTGALSVLGRRPEADATTWGTIKAMYR